jgi:hypothetical protein
VSKKRWFRFHIDRWRDGIFGLTPNEIAVYMIILCELYDNEGVADIDIPVLCRRISMRPTSFQKALDRLLSLGKLDMETGKITSKAVKEELISRAKLGDKSAISRGKVDENSPKNPTKSKGIEKSGGTIQITDNRDTEYIYNFEERKWFSEREIDFLEVAHPDIDIRSKLSEEGFRKWAFEANPQDPLVPARNKIQKLAREIEAQDALLRHKRAAESIELGDLSHLTAALDAKGKHH